MAYVEEAGSHSLKPEVCDETVGLVQIHIAEMHLVTAYVYSLGNPGRAAASPPATK